MNWSQLCPGLMILLSVASAAGYGVSGDIRRMVYWIAAAVLTATVTMGR